MSKLKFQGGGVVDEADLFSDDAAEAGSPGTAAGEETVAGEYQDPGPGEDDDPEFPEAGEEGSEDPAPAPAPDVFATNDEGLSGIDLFLSDYGVRGGIIKFEDGESAHFSELTPEGQQEVLSSLVSKSVPTVEDKFNLDEGEIMFLNALRESGAKSVEEFVNGVVDHRMDTVINEQSASTIDFKGIADDDIYLMHLRESHPEFDDNDLSEELVKARDLKTYLDTVDVLRDSYEERQEALKSEIASNRDRAYYTELEGQRHEIASTINDIGSIAGAEIQDDVKEYLLHDIMELNEHNDPILMEKIFGDPETMFKASWFLEYGEDYIENLNAYWKKEVSKATKQGYEQSINGMPGQPTILGGGAGARKGSIDDTGAPSFGQEVDEEDLFK